MPIHDWTRVNSGTFHDFHLAWIAELRRVLNGGLLPEGYYALAEQVAGQVAPDVLTLQDLGGADGDARARRERGKGDNGLPGGVAVVATPPRVAVSDTITESMYLATRRKNLVIRHTTGDRSSRCWRSCLPGTRSAAGCWTRSSTRRSRRSTKATT